MMSSNGNGNGNSLLPTPSSSSSSSSSSVPSIPVSDVEDILFRRNVLTNGIHGSSSSSFPGTSSVSSSPSGSRIRFKHSNNTPDSLSQGEEYDEEEFLEIDELEEELRWIDAKVAHYQAKIRRCKVRRRTLLEERERRLYNNPTTPSFDPAIVAIGASSFLSPSHSSPSSAKQSIALEKVFASSSPSSSPSSSSLQLRVPPASSTSTSSSSQLTPSATIPSSSTPPPVESATTQALTPITKESEHKEKEKELTHSISTLSRTPTTTTSFTMIPPSAPSISSKTAESKGPMESTPTSTLSSSTTSSPSTSSRQQNQNQQNKRNRNNKKQEKEMERKSGAAERPSPSPAKNEQPRSDDNRSREGSEHDRKNSSSPSSTESALPLVLSRPSATATRIAAASLASTPSALPSLQQKQQQQRGDRRQAQQKRIDVPVETSPSPSTINQTATPPPSSSSSLSSSTSSSASSSSLSLSSSTSSTLSRNISSSELNYLFFSGKITAKPKGGRLDDIHSEWYLRYDILETEHSYIQWLFPRYETPMTDGGGTGIGMGAGANPQAKPLDREEAKKIRGEIECCLRLLWSYRMMLNFWGFRLTDPLTGRVERHPDLWFSRGRLANVCMRQHNCLRITRVLISLGQLGFSRYKKPFLEALRLAVTQNEQDGSPPPLAKCLRSLKEFWEVACLEKDSLTKYQKLTCEKGPEDRVPSVFFQHVENQSDDWKQFEAWSREKEEEMKGAEVKANEREARLAKRAATGGNETEGVTASNNNRPARPGRATNVGTRRQQGKK